MTATPELAQTAFHRNFESEADLLAVICMHAAGYDPQALASYIGRMQPAGNGDPASELPDRDRRITAIGDDIQRLSANEFSHIQTEVRASLQ